MTQKSVQSLKKSIFLKKLVPGDSTLVVDRPMREQDMKITQLSGRDLSKRKNKK
jgi:hypothetical protein